MEEDVLSEQTNKRDSRIKLLEEEIGEKDDLIEDLESQRDDLNKEVSKQVIDLQGEDLLKGSKRVLTSNLITRLEHLRFPIEPMY